MAGFRSWHFETTLNPDWRRVDKDITEATPDPDRKTVKSESAGYQCPPCCDLETSLNQSLELVKTSDWRRLELEVRRSALQLPGQDSFTGTTTPEVAAKSAKLPVASRSSPSLLTGHRASAGCTRAAGSSTPALRRHGPTVATDVWPAAGAKGTTGATSSGGGSRRCKARWESVLEGPREFLRFQAKLKQPGGDLLSLKRRAARTRKVRPDSAPVADRPAGGRSTHGTMPLFQTAKRADAKTARALSAKLATAEEAAERVQEELVARVIGGWSEADPRLARRSLSPQRQRFRRVSSATRTRVD
eukprot:gnl/TRDRNA2_/TRDRNA2_69924_c0_seq1.p1 gnl/TRDRNA2_/TRDRNA2_69924_c0~~gnl/TRDRNA2_/TRDRNA2_69924_c0_seq1.p1  ORF type:complete len:303 (+),score=24.36 gnl/TRDRNA2_/TRDRNA2_69924_c0_seq1:87-995(+)